MPVHLPHYVCTMKSFILTPRHSGFVVHFARQLHSEPLRISSRVGTADGNPFWAQKSDCRCNQGRRDSFD
jgi:hypothetical protein